MAKRAERGLLEALASQAEWALLDIGDTQAPRVSRVHLDPVVCQEQQGPPARMERMGLQARLAETARRVPRVQPARRDRGALLEVPALPADLGPRV